MTKACYKNYSAVLEKGITEYLIYLLLITSAPHKVLFVTDFVPPDFADRNRAFFFQSRDILLPSKETLALPSEAVNAHILRPLFVVSTQYREVVVFNGNFCNETFTKLLDRDEPTEIEALLAYYGFRFTDNPAVSKGGKVA